MGTWLAGINYKTIYDNIVSIWLAVFLLYYVAVVVVGIIQSVRRKDLWETSAFAPLMLAHFALFTPIALALYFVTQVFAYVLTIPFYLIAAGFWLWHCIVGKPKKQKRESDKTQEIKWCKNCEHHRSSERYEDIYRGSWRPH